jgi:hypothetical protein
MTDNMSARGVSPFDVVVWTCTLVFVVTAVAACASLLNFTTIRPGYENLVYSALIVQILGVGVAAFARGLGVKRPPEVEGSTPDDPPSEAEERPASPQPIVLPKRQTAVLLSLIALIAVVGAVGSGLNQKPFEWQQETIAASDLAVGDSCQLAVSKLVIGKGKVQVPDHCDKLVADIAVIREGAEVDFFQIPSASGTGLPGLTGSAGLNGAVAGAPGGTGYPGGPGGKGLTGLRSSAIDLTVGKLLGALSIKMAGGAGGSGARGGSGGNGGAGATGEPSLTDPNDSGYCVRWAGPGGRGGDGGAGGMGGGGGDGGNVNKVDVWVKTKMGDKSAIKIEARGGAGGIPGMGGDGGTGGEGGPEGAISSGCQIPRGYPIVPGARGPHGPSGNPGQAGKDGEIVLHLPAETEHANGTLNRP